MCLMWLIYVHNCLGWLGLLKQNAIDWYPVPVIQDISLAGLCASDNYSGPFMTA